MRNPSEIATKFFGQPLDALDKNARKVARHVAERKHIARNLAASDKAPSFGQRAADRVAAPAVAGAGATLDAPISAA